jgi:hypothetical protein
MVLQEKLMGIQMLKSELVTSYLDRFTQTRDQLAEVREIVDPNFSVRTTLNDFSKPWGSFVQGIMAREVMPSWERLWGDFVQEVEMWLWIFKKTMCIVEGDEDLALWSKGKKKVDKGTKQGPKGGAKSQESGSGQKRDMNKVKCFACKKMGHYVGQCSNRKNKMGGTTTTTYEEEFQA